MSSRDQVSVNGNMFSWGSVTCLFAGTPFTGIKSIKYADKRERVKAYGLGAGQTARGKSRGKYTAEAGLTVWKDSAEEFRQFLASLDPTGSGSFGNAFFQWSIQYYETDLGLLDVELVGCTIEGDDSSEEEGGDPFAEEFKVDPIAIIRNGVTLFDNQDGFVATVLGAGAGGLNLSL